MRCRAMLSWVVVTAVVALAAACGGSSPSSPSSGSGSVAIQGVVLSGAAATSGGAQLTASSGFKAGSSTITVTVLVNGVSTGITTTVSANGTFELKNVPSGSLTLVFTMDGVTIGTVPITVSDGAEVKITVQVQTASQTTTLVVIQIQIDEQESESGTSTTTPSTCAISGGKVHSGIELEGNVSSGTFAAFKMTVNGERSSAVVDVAAGTASFKCNGSPKAGDTECKATLKPGAKVHVRGTLMTCSTSEASVTATEVMIQKAEGEDD